MRVNFDIIANRKNTNCYKYDTKPNTLPLWVADMDFSAPQEVEETIINKAKIGAYGYTLIPNSYYESVKNWMKNRHGLSLNNENIIYSTGVVASISSLVRKLTSVAEKVLIQGPVYNIFYNCIINNGRYVLSSSLKEENGVYSIDFVDLESKMADPQCTLMILCNPHNPVGKIFSEKDLAKIGSLAKANGVTVIADEIHNDMVRDKHQYHPFASINDVNKDISITLIAPSKTFNMAGLHSSSCIVYNQNLYNKVYRALNTDEIAEPNFFAIEATITACNKCAYWLDELNAYIDENYHYAKKFIEDNLPHVIVSPLEATYLLWINLAYYNEDSSKVIDYLEVKTGLFISKGINYGNEGKAYARINLATNKETIIDAFNRLKIGLDAYEKECK